MSQLKKGAALSYVTIILTNAVGLLLTPFIIRCLGNSEYGLYTLIGSLIGYISVLDLGLNNTIIRFVSKYRAKQDKQGENNFLATVMIIYAVISMAIVIIGVGLYFNLDSFFDKLTPQELIKAKIMFGILIFNLAITLPGGAFTAISSAYEHFVFPRAMNIVKYIVRSIMVVGLLLWGGDSVALVVLDTIVNVVAIGINVYYVVKVLKARFALRHFEKSLVREIFRYSIWIFIFAMVGQFQWQSGQLILGKISGPIAVGIYGVGILLGTYYGAFSTAISGVFLPRATKMTVLEASGAELTDMMTRIGRFSLIALLMIFGGFLIFGQQFVNLWVGEHYAESWTIAIIIMFSYTLPLVQSFANSILEARSLFAFKAVTYISLIVIGTGIGAYLVRFYGLTGIIYGSAGGWILSQILVNIYYNRVLKLQILRFFKELMRGLLPVFLVILAIGYGIDFLPGSGWFNLVIKIGLFGAVYAFLMFRFAINADEKRIFIDAIPFLKNTKHA
ncbi:MAG: polysaccharide biosynthesis protein [Flavobacterium sp.]|uniref:oligosaccharide flippase family protein n=1 Tax=Flavobacterium sp. TaxID=239 RepID=UPI00121A79D6|nr:oligosaccharide flippase family protein [Flavobacterium sp.]RZJ65409.1 MAG: polysaccharide biosynthesis protein [Flavobacterium sp.]